MSLTSYRAAPSRGDFALIWVSDQGGIVSRDTVVVFSRFGGDLLSHVLRRSTIGATALNDRVRNGAGCFARAMTTKPKKDHAAPKVRRVAGSVSRSEARCHTPSFRVRVHQPAHLGGVVCVEYTVCVYAFECSQSGFSPCLLLDQIKPIGPLVPVN